MVWICEECGDEYGEKVINISSWHNGTCDYCGEERVVTENRDYGYPKKPEKRPVVIIDVSDMSCVITDKLI